MLENYITFITSFYIKKLAYGLTLYALNLQRLSTSLHIKKSAPGFSWGGYILLIYIISVNN